MRGFSTTEWIVILVGLVVLAGFLVPRLLGLQANANTAAIRAAAASADAAATVLYSHANDSERKQALAFLSYQQQAIEVSFAQPTATRAGIMASLDIDAASDLSAKWLYFVDNQQQPALLYLTLTALVQQMPTQDAQVILATNCYVIYQQASTQQQAKVTSNETGC